MGAAFGPMLLSELLDCRAGCGLMPELRRPTFCLLPGSPCGPCRYPRRRMSWQWTWRTAQPGSLTQVAQLPLLQL